MTVTAAFTRRTFLVAATTLPAWPALAALETPKLYDSHLHFFTNDIAHYPIDPRNSREGEVVMRARIMSDPDTPEKVFAWWAKNGVTGGTGVQYKGAYKTDNSYVLDLADKYPEKIHPEILIDARDPASPDTLRQLAATRRVAALRLTGFIDDSEEIPWLNSKPALEVWKVADELALPVGITFLPPKGAEGPLLATRRLADRFQRCPIVLEHFGRLVNSDLSDAHLALRPYSHVHFKWTTNVIVELKGRGRPVPAFLRRAVDSFGADRIMWGSDCGNTLIPYADMVADAIGSTRDLTVKERSGVLHDNGLAMFTRRVGVHPAR